MEVFSNYPERFIFMPRTVIMLRRQYLVSFTAVLCVVRCAPPTRQLGSFTKFIFRRKLITKFVFAIIGIQSAAETKKKWPWTPVKDNNFGEKSYFIRKRIHYPPGY